jgi:PIN domain nuclease of toxin-antitoxin system
LLLLDTCAVIWVANRDPLSAAGLDQIRKASEQKALLVSPVSAWEIGLLASSPKIDIEFDPSPALWLASFLARSDVQLVPLAPAAALAASFLPGDLHRDPADRLLIATARHIGAPLITRDRAILAYAARDHVQAIAC